MINFASYSTLLVNILLRKSVCLGRYSEIWPSGVLDRCEVVVRELAPQQKAGEKGAADEFVLTRSGLLC